MISSIDYVSVPVEDLGRAVSFCRDVLGLRLAFELPGRWAEFHVGSIRFAVYPREEDEGRGGDVAFLVQDLPAEVERLKNQGVAFPHGIEEFALPTGRGRLARFRDPSANKLELIERL